VANGSQKAAHYVDYNVPLAAFRLPVNAAIIACVNSFDALRIDDTVTGSSTSSGLRVIFLPPYFPDNNPIEKKWENLKKWLRLNAKNYLTIQEALSAYFKTE
jgi:hypothetical protein